ncbi:MAG TPA: hypothetical protein VH640_25470 [Bryobacteraceae bacterium]
MVPPTADRISAPDSMVYFFLFDHITRQDSLAAQQAAVGKNGNAIKTYYASAVGITPPISRSCTTLLSRAGLWSPGRTMPPQP